MFTTAVWLHYTVWFQIVGNHYRVCACVTPCQVSPVNSSATSFVISRQEPYKDFRNYPPVKSSAVRCLPACDSVRINKQGPY